MEQLRTYYDFADNDCRYFLKDCQEGRIANYMCGVAQGICEKYLKHLIDKFDTNPNPADKLYILRTHNLKTLLKYVTAYIPDLHINKDTRDKIEKINGYYFTARYPGDDSITADKSDIDDCEVGVMACKQLVDTFLLTHEPKDHNNDIDDDFTIE